jgi:hypothetical protein
LVTDFAAQFLRRSHEKALIAREAVDHGSIAPIQ